MTEQDAIELGFELERTYKHDTYKTNRLVLGRLEMEFTYKNGELINSDLTILEINCIPVSLDELRMLASVLG